MESAGGDSPGKRGDVFVNAVYKCRSPFKRALYLGFKGHPAVVTVHGKRISKDKDLSSVPYHGDMESL